MAVQIVCKVRLPTIREAIEEEFAANPAMLVMSGDNSAHWFNAVFGTLCFLVALLVGHLVGFFGFLVFGLIAGSYLHDV